MDRFYIITNSDKDPKLQITGKIVNYLKEHQKKCAVQQAERKHEGSYHYTDPDQVPDDTQCIIVLGGDGTLLQAARDVDIKRFRFWASTLEIWDFLRKWISRLYTVPWISLWQMTTRWKNA